MDPEHQGLGGHHLTSLELLQKAFHPRRPTCHVNASSPPEITEILGSVRFDFETDPARPVRQRRIFHFNRLRWYMLQAISRLKGFPADTVDGTDYADEMRAVVGRYGPSDHLIFPTTKADTLASLLVVLDQMPADELPNLHLRFLEYAPSHDYGLATRNFARLSEFCRNSDRIHIYTETETLRRCLTDEFGIKHVRRAILQPPKADPHFLKTLIADDRKIRIGYVGGNLRTDKGYSRLPNIFGLASGKLAQSSLSDKIEYVIQVADTRRGRRLVRQLQSNTAIRPDQLNIVPGPLDLKEFSALIASCDVVVFPYTHDKIDQMISSGILIDSVINGVPVICPPIPTLTEFITDETGVVAESDEDFADAILRVVSDIKTYKANAAGESETYADAWRRNDLVQSVFCKSDLAKQVSSIR